MKALHLLIAGIASKQNGKQLDPTVISSIEPNSVWKEFLLDRCVSSAELKFTNPD
jgi:hypothetical protein